MQKSGGRFEKITVHCSDSNFGDRATIRDWHLRRGFDDIGYHFVILNGYLYSTASGFPLVMPALDGSIEVGRPLKYYGAHVKGYNSANIGICLIGKSKFTAGQLRSMNVLIDNLKKEFTIPEENVKPHNFYNKSKTCPNIDLEYIRSLVC